MKRALQIPAYRRLVVAYGLNELAWLVGTLALTVLVYRRTGSALGSAAFFVFSQVLPGVLSPVIAARIDQRPPRRVLPGLYALEAVLFGVLAWMTARFSLPAVLALVFVDGSVASVARALSRAATATILRPVDLLHEGNAFMNMIFSVAYMSGPAIGGIVVAAGGTVAALLVNCGLFAAIAFVLATARSLPAAPNDLEPTAGRLRAALDYVRSDRALHPMLLLQGAGLLAFTVAVPVEVVLAQHTLHAGPGGYGAILSAWGGGAVLGSVAYARWRRAPGATIMIISALAVAVGYGTMAAAPTVVVAAAGGVFGGAGNAGGGISARTLLQQYTPRNWMAMVMSLNESVSLATPGLGIVLGGVITTLANPRVAMAVAAVGAAAYAVGVWGWLRPSVLPPPPDQEPETSNSPSGHKGTSEESIPITPEGRETLASP
jgi:MFS family permease